jgi:hypothetical protein
MLAFQDLFEQADVRAYPLVENQETIANYYMAFNLIRPPRLPANYAYRVSGMQGKYFIV